MRPSLRRPTPAGLALSRLVVGSRPAALLPDALLDSLGRGLAAAPAYAFRDRSHYLGDSEKSFAILERALSGLIGEHPYERLTFSAFFLSLGMTQLFFGYGESYTLVAVAVVLILYCGLRHLRGEFPLLWRSLALLLAAACQLLALCVARGSSTLALHS